MQHARMHRAKWFSRTMAVMSAFALALGAPGIVWAGNLVVNGGFEMTANETPPNYPDGDAGLPGSGGVGQIDYNTAVTGWSNPNMDYTNQTGYNFIWNPATASSTGVVGYNGGVSLYGPGNGFNNGLGPSPAGGQFLGADGDTRFNGPIEQTINGLTPGTYQLGFWWALAQQSTAGGTPMGQWEVTLGNQTQSTAFVTLPSPGGFVPWMYQTFDFTVTSSGSELLSFLANEGGPFGGPPFLLLDGVSLGAVPEPGALLLLSLGLVGVGIVRRFRKPARA